MDARTATETTVADLVRDKLAQARDQLIERNLRNKLVNCALTSKRSKQVRVIDELSDEVFKTLLLDKKEMSFAPGLGVQSEDAGEKDPEYTIWAPPEKAALDVNAEVILDHPVPSSPK